MKLYIIRDENFEDWQVYEVYDCLIGCVILHTEDWNRVIEFLNNDIPTPEIVTVN